MQSDPLLLSPDVFENNVVLRCKTLENASKISLKEIPFGLFFSSTNDDRFICPSGFDPKKLKSKSTPVKEEEKKIVERREKP
jgi:hypothetical protein